MSEDNELLDDGYGGGKEEEKKKFNYRNYTFSYVFLMITIGTLVSKIMSNFELKPYHLFIGALIYIAYGMIISLMFEGLSFGYRKVVSKKPFKKDIHPTWFRIIETCFYAWCVIIFVTYFGNKVL